MLQALLLQVDPSDKALHDVLIDIRLFFIQVIKVEALLIQDTTVELAGCVIERCMSIFLQLL